mgnify:CR=1 FL=1
MVLVIKESKVMFVVRCVSILVMDNQTPAQQVYDEIKVKSLQSVVIII